MNINEIIKNWPEKYLQKIDNKDFLDCVEPEQKIFIGSGAASPQKLLTLLANSSDRLHNNELIHILTLGMDITTEPNFQGKVRHSNYFVGANVRKAVNECRADYTPIFLSEIPRLFKSGSVSIDVALIQVSLPDQHGFVSYGVAVDIVKSATEAAKCIVVEINPNMPRTLGDSFLHLDKVSKKIIFSNEEIPEMPPHKMDEVSDTIGKNIASLIEDGSTLQMGIGAIPDAVLQNLFEKRNLGIHTEMFSDGLLPLVEKGIITCKDKNLHRGKIITSFVMGSRKLYDFVDDNPFIEFRPSQYTNDPFIIAQNDKMVAINSALEVDLTGQVCADSIGYRFYSGIGGQVDFIRGVARSRGGKPIIALPSTAKNDTISRISVQLSDGAGVVTTRGDVHYIVTEFGVAYLYGKNIRERALALINIAHPKFRQELLDGAKNRGYLQT